LGTRYDRGVSATEPLRALLERAFPDATELDVHDRTGGGDHFHVTVASGRFDGLSLVEQHKLVYDALAEPLADGTIHELRIKTKGGVYAADQKRPGGHGGGAG
jgi:stress-induced morphogen